jgi:spore germination cell wall hydrolase CwlJ-like protein
MDEARAYNARVPFAPGKLLPAAPFHFHGTPAAREQAVQCLATAALYEAGDDPRGQAAVIQVVLNRVRRPGFPKTVCGVVYQGAALPTGCQFSFTCDGSVARRPERAGWDAARLTARHALGGHVFRPVGTATHYHADWMVPYWIGSLDKIAKVNSHIFYRPKAPVPAS